MDEVRALIRCPNCRLNQFTTTSGLCRRCREPFVKPVPAGEARLAAAMLIPEPPELFDYTAGLDVARAIKLVRMAKGISQSGMARAAGVPRTYISKLETHTAVPTIKNFLRMAAALDVTPGELLRFAQVIAQQAPQTEAA